MNFILFIQTVLMGIVQGITEWLPISSTGHLILFDQFLKMDVSPVFMETFKVVIQFGSILAVLVVYWQKLNPFCRKSQENCYRISNNVNLKKSTIELYLKVLVGIIPAGVIGVLFDDVIENYLSSPWVIAAALIVYGVIFIIVENMKFKPKFSELEDLTYKTAFLIGAFQVLALIPGTSRSGSTIIGAVIIGCSRFVAAEFSFFLAIPVMLGASALKLLKAFMEGVVFTGAEWITLILGTLVSFVVSVLAIKFLVSYIRKHDFKGFGYYRIVLGIIIILYYLIAVL